MLGSRDEPKTGTGVNSTESCTAAPSIGDASRTLTEVRGNTHQPGVGDSSGPSASEQSNEHGDAVRATPHGTGRFDNGSLTNDHQLPVGDTERYRITAEYSRGGLGRILSAHDESLGRTVAVKELLTRSNSNESRFVREALITARLQHPGIVPVHEAGRWPSGDPYYVMKLISGQTLKQAINDCVTVQKRLSLLPNAIAVADAIAYAHNQGIIHRDIKPSNVVVGDFGETIVVDWGLALDLNEEADKSTVGSIVGTPQYMSLEQSKAQPIDSRADVYSLGALLYHLLTGNAPYSSSKSNDSDANNTSEDSNASSRPDPLELLAAGPPTSVKEIASDVPSDLAAIVEKAMSRERGGRYKNAGTLAADLKRFQVGQLVTAAHYTSFGLLRRWVRRHRGAVIFTAVALTLIAVLLVLATVRVVDERNTAQSERAQAREAQASGEQRQAELLFLHAKSSLLSDPTATVAWLKQYPAKGPRSSSVAKMASNARSQGVASHVIEQPGWALGAWFAGNRVLSLSSDKHIHVWELAAETSKIVNHRVLPTPPENDYAIAVSSDAKWLAYGSGGGLIVVVDLEQETEALLPGHSEEVTRLQFASSTAQNALPSTPPRLISIGLDATTRIWDPATTKLLEQLPALGPRSRQAVARDGSVIAEVGPRHVRWRRASGESEWKQISIPALPPIRHFVVMPLLNAASPVGALVAKGGDVFAVDFSSGTLRAMGNHPGNVSGVRTSPSGRYVATAGGDRVVRVWDLIEGDVDILRGHLDSIYNIDFSPDETLLSSASDDGTARLWDLRSRGSVVLRGHTDDVVSAEFSEDGTSLVTASLDGTLRVWPTQFDDSVVLARDGAGAKPGEPNIVEVSFPRSTEIVSQNRLGEVTVWEFGSAEPIHESATFVTPKSGDQWNEKSPAVRVDASGRRIVGHHEGGGLLLWQPGGASKILLKHPNDTSIVSFAFTGDGDGVIGSDIDGNLVSWLLEKPAGEIVGRIEAQTLGAKTVSETRDGATLFTTDRELVIRETSGSMVRHQLTTAGSLFDDVQPNNPFAIKVAPLGDQVAAFRATGLIVVCHRRDASCLDHRVTEARVMALDFSPDSKTVAIAGSDRSVRLLSDKTERVLRGHQDLVNDVAFSPTGTWLASASYDKTVRLWNPASGETHVLRGHRESVETLSFSPMGGKLASAGRDGTIRIWDVEQITSKPADLTSLLNNLTTTIIRGDRPISPHDEPRAN